MADPELEKAMKEAAASVDARRPQVEAEDPDEGTVMGDRPNSMPPPPAPPPQAAAAGADVYTAAKRELEEAMEKVKKDAADLKDKWVRTAADLENYKKRAAREREEVVKFGNERILKDLLPILDDLDRTIGAAEVTPDNQALMNFVEGAKLVQKKFLTQLEKNGVEGFAVLGQPFDPTQHEAVQQVNHDSVPAGAVSQEIRRGFYLNGRLLRPALVAVSLGPKS